MSQKSDDRRDGRSQWKESYFAHFVDGRVRSTDERFALRENNIIIPTPMEWLLGVGVISFDAGLRINERQSRVESSFRSAQSL